MRLKMINECKESRRQSIVIDVIIELWWFFRLDYFFGYPALKLLFFLYIDHFTHDKFYVVLDVRNRAREDAKIVWLQDGVAKSQDCPQSERCLISFEIPDKDGSDVAKPIEFSAISKKTGRQLNMNGNPSVSIKPSHYRRIQRALIEAPGKMYTCTTTKLTSFKRLVHVKLYCIGL